jgi:hypothetical protein
MLTSTDTNEIIPALFKAGKEIKNTVASKVNPFFNSKYTPLDDLLDYIKPILFKYDLLIIQDAIGIEDRLVIESRIIHISGQWINTEVYIPIEKQTAQSAGISITYGRRYALSSLLNITSDDDLDGNSNDQNKKNTTLSEKVKEEFTKPNGNYQEGIQHIGAAKNINDVVDHLAQFSWTQDERVGLKKVLNLRFEGGKDK